MRISIDLSEEEAKALSEVALSLGISPEELVRSTVTDVFGHPRMSFEDAKQYVIKKNEELFRRLA
ncbi:MAG: DNA-binding protein [Candidatus Coatesbacteria bacterium]|nr:DNA-binding protein [Candidatus Coatesbacteria bacterium]